MLKNSFKKAKKLRLNFCETISYLLWGIARLFRRREIKRLKIQKPLPAMIFGQSGIGIVFCIHRISDGDDDLSLSYDNFMRLVNACKAINSIDDLKKGGFFLTFDDGFGNDNLTLYEELINQNIPFCLFLSTVLLGEDNFLSINQIKRIKVSNCCAIGFHTADHVILSETCKKQAQFEIMLSKKRFESLAGLKIKYFAYPWGSKYDFNNYHIDVVKKTGYEYAFSTEPRPFSNDDLNSKYAIPRVQICNQNFSDVMRLVNEFVNKKN